MKNQIKKIIETYEQIEKILNNKPFEKRNRGYGYRYTHRVINAKIHVHEVEGVDEHIDSLELSNSQKEELKAHFNDQETQASIISHCLDQEFGSFKYNAIDDGGVDELKIINRDHVELFGRNGGWLGFAEIGSLMFDVLENQEYIEQLRHLRQWDGLKLFRELRYKLTNLNLTIEGENIRDNWIEVLSDSSLKEFLQNLYKIGASLTEELAMLVALEDYVDRVRNNFVDNVWDEFIYELENYIEEELTPDATNPPKRLNTVARIEGDTITTDLGAMASIQRIKQLIESFRAGGNVIGEAIGSYIVRKHFNLGGEDYFRVGCHTIKLSQIEQQILVN